MLERLADDGACALVSDAAVEKALAVETSGKHGMRHGRVQTVLTYECAYDRAIPSLQISVSSTYPEQSDQEILDRWFRDRSKQDRPVTEYEDVPDLGRSARLGPIPHYALFRKHWQLVALCEVEGERLLLRLMVYSVADGDPLRGLARDAISALAG